MDIILEYARPVGNAIAKYVFTNRLVEQDSSLSETTGLLFLLAALFAGIWIIAGIVG